MQATDTQDMTSAEALQRVASTRDSAAWAVLVERHGGEILRVCTRILSDRALAEDACQETLLQVRDKAGQFSGSGAENLATARAWILRIAANSALQLLRERKRAAAREAKHARQKEPAMQPEFFAESSEQSDAVRRELGALNEEERLPIVLHYYAGLAYDQVATALGCPVGTAKARVSRGVDKLRQRLAVMGLVIAAGQLEAALGGGVTHAAEVGAAGSAAASAAPSGAQFAAWKQLLNSPAHAASAQAAGAKGSFSMVKMIVAMTVLIALLASGAVLWLARHNPSALQHIGPALSCSGSGTSAPAAPAINVPAAQPDDLRAVVDGNNRFAFDLFKAMRTEQKGNLIYSPLSVSTTLAMAYAGAAGATRDQMARVLRFPAEIDVHVSFHTLLKQLQTNSKGFNVAIANRAWLQRDSGITLQFRSITQSHYGAEALEVDFTKDSEAVRQYINAWVAQQTQDKIQNLLESGLLNKDTRAVLTNAVYLKANWRHKFELSHTQKRPFTLATGQKIAIATMQQEHELRYADLGEFKLLELPYAGGDAALLVLLPKAIDGAAKIEAALNAQDLRQWLARLGSEDVNVMLPKFKLRTSAQLVNDLQLLGLQLPFSREADFSAMNDKQGLFISEVVHQAMIDVDEFGTEAAAATALGLKAEDKSEKVNFIVDRPFVFLLHDQKTGSILFMGRVMDPRNE